MPESRERAPKQCFVQLSCLGRPLIEKTKFSLDYLCLQIILFSGGIHEVNHLLVVKFPAAGRNRAIQQLPNPRLFCRFVSGEWSSCEYLCASRLAGCPANALYAFLP